MGAMSDLDIQESSENFDEDCEASGFCPDCDAPISCCCCPSLPTVRSKSVSEAVSKLKLLFSDYLEEDLYYSMIKLEKMQTSKNAAKFEREIRIVESKIKRLRNMLKNINLI